MAGFAAVLAHVRHGVDCAFSTSADSGAMSSNWETYVDGFRNINPGPDHPEQDQKESYCVINTIDHDSPTTNFLDYS